MTSFRSDQVGSLLRPPPLIQAKLSGAKRELDPASVVAVEDRSIEEVLELQRQIGMDVLTDGEYRRWAFVSEFTAAVEGFTTGLAGTTWRGGNSEGEERLDTAVVTGRLRQKRRLAEHEAAFLLEHAGGPFKVTLPSPQMFGMMNYQKGVSDQFYPTRRDLLMDLAGIIRSEVQSLIEEGVPYIQIDAPRYSQFVDQSARASMLQQGEDLDEFLADLVEADTAVLTGLARNGVTLGMHVCRGNNRSQWLAEGGYEPIAEQLFNSIPVDRFLLEYDSDRAGGFEPLRFMPKDKVAVLGLVSTKTGELESQDELLRRIDQAAQFVDLNRLALSPQCGFASGIFGNLLSWDDQRRKLELVVDTARKVWS